MYCWRHFDESFVSDREQFRGIPTHYDKTDQNFAAFSLLRAVQSATK